MSPTVSADSDSDMQLFSCNLQYSGLVDLELGDQLTSWRRD